MAELNETQLVARMHAIGMDRLEHAVRRAASLVVDVLKVRVAAGLPEPEGPASASPFLYATRSGKLQRRRRENETARRQRRGVPHSTGAGQRSICYEIRKRDDAAGTIVVGIGVNASAPGGTKQLQSYMMAHEFGIKYPTRPGNNPARFGHVIQRPWLRPTVTQYLPHFTAIVQHYVEGP